MFHITTEIGKKRLSEGVKKMEDGNLPPFPLTFNPKFHFFNALPKNDPERKFFAGGLPHAASYDPV